MSSMLLDEENLLLILDDRLERVRQDIKDCIAGGIEPRVILDKLVTIVGASLDGIPPFIIQQLECAIVSGLGG